MLLQGNNELDSKYLVINVGVNEKNVGVKTSDRIIELIRENNKITIPEMAKRLDKTTRSIERAIQNLKQKNLIIREGADKTGFWRIL